MERETRAELKALREKMTRLTVRIVDSWLDASGSGNVDALALAAFLETTETTVRAMVAERKKEKGFRDDGRFGPLEKAYVYDRPRDGGGA